MAKDVLVRIKGSDDLSPVFKKVGASAKGAAGDIKSLDAELKATEQSAHQAAAGYAQFSSDVTQVGQAVGVAAGALALSGQAYRNQQVALNTLGRTYGEATQQVLDFTQQLEDASNFSDEAITRAANIAGTLARNYGFTQQEIQQVLQISADLAAATGYSMEDATYRVTAALRGEAEAAEALGLTMNQQAIDSQNLTLSMSNQEAGHFRLNALIQQSAFAMGAAAEQADTTYGAMSDLGQGITDAAQSVGEFLGPIGEIGAYAADNALKIGIMGLALKQLAEGAAGLNNLTAAMTGVNVASKLMTSGLIGPVGIAGAAVLAAAGLYELWQRADGMVAPLDMAEQHVKALEQTIRELYAAGSTLAVLGERATEGIFPDLEKDIARVEELQTAIEETNRAASESGQDLTDEQQANLERWSMELLDIADKYGLVDAAQLRTTISAETLAQAADDLNAVLQDTGVGAGQAQQETADLIAEYEAGHISAATFVKDLHTIATSLESYDENATKGVESTKAATTAIQEYLNGLRDVSDSGRTFISTGAGIVATLNDITAAATTSGDTTPVGEYLADLRDSADDGRTFISAGAGIVATLGAISTATEAATLATREMGQSLDEAVPPGKLAAINAQFQATATGLYDLGAGAAHFVEPAKTVEDLLGDLSTRFDAATLAVTGTTDALESGFRVAVGNTDSIAKQAQAVADWATELGTATEHFDEWGNSLGWWSRMDEVVEGTTNGIQAATLSTEQYTAAQTAFNDIARENAEIQQDIAVIQAQQAPIVADLMEQQENYLQSLAESSPEQQRFALAMMDSATSAQALQLATSLLGENGDVFAPMVEQAALLDPYLATILEQMGLIKVETDAVTGEKTITFTLDDQASSPLEKLNDTIEKLAYTEILISVGFDTEKANQEFEEIFGYKPGQRGQPTTVEIPVIPEVTLVKPPDFQGALDGLNVDLEPVDVNVPVNVTPVFQTESAAGRPGYGGGPIDLPNIPDISVTVTADTSQAESSLATAQSALETYSGTSGEATIGADNSEALSNIGTAESSRDAWGSSSATAQINAADNASGVIASVSGALAALDGQTATTYINTVYTTTGTPSIGAASGRVIPHLANGGYPVITAEVGPELARLSGGGFALMSGPGMRVLQPGDLVFNSPASKSMMDGHSLGGFAFYNYGTIIGVDDLEAKIARSISSGIVKAQDQRNRGWAF